MTDRFGVKVEIIAHGQSLPIYYPSQNGFTVPYSEFCYVEAVTDAKFSVKVTLTEEFRMWGAEAVEVHLAFDGGDPRILFSPQENYFRSRRHYSFDFSQFRQYDVQTRQWKLVEFSFQHLQLQDSIDTVFLPPEQWQNLGLIEISVLRVKKDKLVHTRPEDYQGQFGGLNQVSERLLKDKSISNTVKSVAGPTCAAPPRIDWSYVPLRGREGRPIKFRILYRSRSILQSLGCIPRTPSPPPNTAAAIGTSPVLNASSLCPPATASAASPAHAAPTTDPAQEIQELRARLVLLERSLNIKREPTNPTIHNNIMTTVKRERIDKENTPDCKRRKLTKAIEVVDLTAD